MNNHSRPWCLAFCRSLNNDASVKIRSLLVGLTFASLVLAGCSGDNQATQPEPTTTTTTSTTLQPKVGVDDRTGDYAYGEKLVLRESDLPSSWYELEPTSLEDLDAALAFGDEIAKCMGAPPISQIADRYVYGPEFGLGYDYITSAVLPHETDEAARQSFARNLDKSSFGCVANVYKRFYEEGPEGAPTEVALGKIPGFANDENRCAQRMILIQQIDGEPSTTFEDVLCVRHDRFEIVMHVTTYNQPPSDDFLRSLLTAAERRVAEAPTAKAPSKPSAAA